MVLDPAGQQGQAAICLRSDNKPSPAPPPAEAQGMAGPQRHLVLAVDGDAEPGLRALAWLQSICRPSDVLHICHIAMVSSNHSWLSCSQECWQPGAGEQAAASQAAMQALFLPINHLKRRTAVSGLGTPAGHEPPHRGVLRLPADQLRCFAGQHRAGQGRCGKFGNLAPAVCVLWKKGRHL